MADDRANAADGLETKVYEHLRAIAGRLMAGERQGGAGHTLTATALVHEAYLKMAAAGGGGGRPSAEDDARFYRSAARAMRNILVDHARRRGAEKRGGGRARLDWTDSIGGVADLAREDHGEQILSLDGAISRLEKIDAQSAEVVRLRFYAGLSTMQTAWVLGVSERTVIRDWVFARAWLLKEVEREA